MPVLMDDFVDRGIFALFIEAANLSENTAAKLGDTEFVVHVMNITTIPVWPPTNEQFGLLILA